MGVDAERRHGRLRRAARRAAGAAGAACLVLCCAWMVAGAGWVVDLAAVFTAQWVWGAAVVGVASAALRSRWGVVLALAAVVAGGAGLVRGRALLPGETGGGAGLRVLVYNAHAENLDSAGVLAVIERADADVVVLIEPEIGLSRAIRWDGVLDDRYPARANRAWVRRAVSEVIVLSRVGLQVVEVGGREGDEPAAMSVVVGEGAGRMGLVAGQPLSPRTAGRWAVGNEQARLVGEQAGRLRERGVPVIFCGDLNSTPAGSRGAVLRGAGLRPAKPLLTPAGTFPAWLAWPLRIAIDDAWVGEGVSVRSWGVVGAGGSDHAGVVVVVEEAERGSDGAGP